MDEEKTLHFTGTIHTEDFECRKWVEKLDAKIDAINERTKVQTREIKELEKKIKELELKIIIQQ
jgi:peptidoglycan hydrolase CwlO-like protein